MVSVLLSMPDTPRGDNCCNFLFFYIIMLLRQVFLNTAVLSFICFEFCASKCLTVNARHPKRWQLLQFSTFLYNSSWILKLCSIFYTLNSIKGKKKQWFLVWALFLHILANEAFIVVVLQQPRLVKFSVSQIRKWFTFWYF